MAPKNHGATPVQPGSTSAHQGMTPVYQGMTPANPGFNSLISGNGSATLRKLSRDAGICDSFSSTIIPIRQKAQLEFGGGYTTLLISFQALPDGRFVLNIKACLIGKPFIFLSNNSENLCHNFFSLSSGFTFLFRICCFYFYVYFRKNNTFCKKESS